MVKVIFKFSPSGLKKARVSQEQVLELFRSNYANKGSITKSVG